MSVLRITCLCGCRAWAYHTRKGTPVMFFTPDCWERAVAHGLALRTRDKRGNGYKVTPAGHAARRAREVRYVCECGDVAESAKRGCFRCQELERLRDELAPRDSRQQAPDEEVYVQRRRRRQHAARQQQTA